MLSTLRSDWTEFVSAVQKDTSTAVKLVGQDAASKLQQLDARVSGHHHDLWEAQVEAEHRMSLPRVYTTPLLPERYPKKKKLQPSEDEDDEEEEEEEDEEIPVDNDDLKGEEERRELRDYIHTFCVADKTEEISDLLMTYPVLQKQMSKLVPVHVSYGEFWMKHFYRCNPERIKLAWDRADAYARKHRQEQLQHVTKSITEPVQLTLTTVKEKINNATSVVVFGNKYKNEEVPYFSTTTSRKEWEDLQLVLNLSERRILTLQEQLQETDIQIVDTERNALELKTELLQVEAALRALEEKDNEKKAKKTSSSLFRNKEESTAPPQHQATAVKDQVVPFIEQAVNQVPIVVEKEYDEPGGSETTETASSASAESGAFSSAAEDHTINNQMDVEQQQEEETPEPTPSVKKEDEEALNETLLAEIASAPEENTMEAKEEEKYDPIDNKAGIMDDQFDEEEEKVGMLETSSVEEEGSQEQQSWFSQSPVVSSSGIMGRLAPSVLKLFGGEEGDVSDGWDYYDSDDDEEEELFSDMSDDDEEEEEEEHHQRQQYPLAAIP